MGHEQEGANLSWSFARKGSRDIVGREPRIRVFFF